MADAGTPSCTVRRLDWADPEIGTIECPKQPMVLRSSFGSGLSRRPGDPPGVVWGVGDRGPNLKIKVALERYGLEHLRPFEDSDGAKLMPWLEAGPTLAELRVHDDHVELVSTIRLTADGEPIPGVPTPGGEHAQCEPALTLEGELIHPHPGGVDSEGLAAFRDGSFMIGDEYGPSLLKVGADGALVSRWGPGALPEIAGKRQLNRGFEAISLSPDEKWLFLAFQSPLAHPDKEAHERAWHVRLWKLDAGTGAVQSQFLYPLDPPERFRRDCAKGKFEPSDIKVSEILVEADGRLLVLERGSETTKIYRTTLDPQLALAAEHLDVGTRPTIEEISGSDGRLPELVKELLLDTDDHPDVAPDLEGMAILSPTELLLVSDNDFGVEGTETSFWRVTFDRPLFADG